MGLIRRIRFGLKIIRYYNNWWVGFLEHFKLIRKKKVIYRLRNGLKILGRPYTFDFGIINEVILNKEYGRLMHHIKEGSTVVDIGGQIGTFSLLAASGKKDITVHTFEPFQENFSIIQKNVRLNKMQDRIFPHNIGIGAKKEKRSFYIHKRRSGSHTLYKELYVKKLDTPFREVKVDIISLKQAFNRFKIKNCDFLKIDCEGAEYEILLNAPKSLFKRIKSISLEYLSNGDVDELQKFLEVVGYDVKKGKKGKRVLHCERL